MKQQPRNVSRSRRPYSTGTAPSSSNSLTPPVNIPAINLRPIAASADIETEEYADAESDEKKTRD
eukprot:8772572-Prorocentrum_lima.AAC.1